MHVQPINYAYISPKSVFFRTFKASKTDFVKQIKKDTYGNYNSNMHALLKLNKSLQFSFLISTSKK